MSAPDHLHAEFERRMAERDYDGAARIAQQIDRHAQAADGYQQGIARHERLSGKISDPLLRQQSIGTLGIYYRAAGEFGRALDCLTLALDICIKADHRPAQAIWLTNLGLLMAHMGRYHEAVQFHEQALSIAQQAGDTRSEAATLADIADCQYRLGRTEQAITAYRQALALEQGRGQVARIAELYTTLARLHWQRNEPHPALEMAQESLTISETLNLSMLLCENARLLALIYLTLQQPALAQQAAEKMLMATRPCHGPLALCVLGIAALRQTDVRAARTTFTEAVRSADAELERQLTDADALSIKAMAYCGLAVCSPDSAWAREAARIVHALLGMGEDQVDWPQLTTLFRAIVGADARNLLTPIVTMLQQ